MLSGHVKKLRLISLSVVVQLVSFPTVEIDVVSEKLQKV